MNPNEIELTNLTKSFEYTKLASKIDQCEDIVELRNLAKSFFVNPLIFTKVTAMASPMTS